MNQWPYYYLAYTPKGCAEGRVKKEGGQSYTKSNYRKKHADRKYFVPDMKIGVLCGSTVVMSVKNSKNEDFYIKT